MTDEPLAPEQRDHQGRLMLHLSPSTDRYFLRRTGEKLELELGAEAKDRFTSPSDVFWDYVVRDQGLSLYWERESGLWLVAGDASDENEAQLRSLAPRLRQHLSDG
ncbi:MAG: hypothetical protein KC457_05865 [Myxococcales bacterium]|nr:hypothetical protein [Myxococcales bacterium]